MSIQEFSERFSNLSVRSSGVLDISGRNLNEILTTGAYGGVNCINAPIEGYIQLIVTHHTNSWIVQEVLALNKDIYLRAYQNGIWYEWQRVDLNNDNGGQGPGITIEVVERDHTHPNATAESKGFMSNTDYIKLAGIESNSNNYTHPLNHSIDMITETSAKKILTTAQINKWDSSSEQITELLSIIDELTTKVDSLNILIANHTEEL